MGTQTGRRRTIAALFTTAVLALSTACNDEPTVQGGVSSDPPPVTAAADTVTRSKTPTDAWRDQLAAYLDWDYRRAHRSGIFGAVVLNRRDMRFLWIVSA